MQRLLGGLHHRVAHRLTRRKPWKGRDGGWVFPLQEDARVEVGFQELETYVFRRQNNVAQYIAARPIMNLFLLAKRRSGPQVTMWWWEQEGLDFEGVQKTAWGVERTKGGEEIDRTKTGWIM